MECEIFLTIFLKNLDPENTPWQRALCMEVFRGLCLDAKLLRSVYEKSDRTEQASDVFKDMVTAFHRLGSEKPALLGNAPLTGVALPTSARESIDYGSVTSMLTSAASAAASATAGAVSFRGEDPHQWSTNTSSIKVQCIDQLDKSDAPQVPDTYIYYLAFLCISAIADGFSQLVSDANVEVTQSDNEATNSADRNLDLVRGMAETAWPGLLASLSFFVGTNMDDELFDAAMKSFQNFCTVCGTLHALTPRDTFLTSLSKLSVPPNVLKNLTNRDSGSATPSSSNVLSKVVGLTIDVAEANAMQLSVRNLRCLQVVMSVGQLLGNTLGPSWYIILETLQNADFVLRQAALRTSKSPYGTPVRKRSAADTKLESTENKDADAQSLFYKSLHTLLESLKELSNPALGDFLQAACRLSTEIVLDGTLSNAKAGSESPASPPSRPVGRHQRRESGMFSSRVARLDDKAFIIEKMQTVITLNIERISLSDECFPAWKLVTDHYVAVAQAESVSGSIRYQAADALTAVTLEALPHIMGDATETQNRMQIEVLTSLKGITNSNSSNTSPEASSVRHEVQRRGLHTLHDILQREGHAINVGWSLVFDMIRGATETTPPTDTSFSVTSEEISTIHEEPRTPTVHSEFAGGQDSRKSAIIRAAFASLQLICTDFLSSLDLACLKACIEALGAFGSLPDDMNASFTSVGLLWNVADFVQSQNRQGTASASISTEDRTNLWMVILQQLLSICYDMRPEVRNGAVQTIFRTLDMNGNSLTIATWHRCVWDILFPLIEVCSNKIAQQQEQARIAREEESKEHEDSSIADTPSGRILQNSTPRQWDDTQAIVLSGVASTFKNFLSDKLVDLDDIEEAWTQFLNRLEKIGTTSSSSLSLSTFKSMSTVFAAVEELPTSKPKAAKIGKMWHEAWLVWERVGTTIATPPTREEQAEASDQFTQETLAAYIEAVSPLYQIVAPDLSDDEISRLLNVLRGIVTYSRSPQYAPDVDSLSSLQKSVIELVNKIQTGQSKTVPSLVITFVAELVTLAYLASFETEPMPIPGFGGKERTYLVSYVALSKIAMKVSLEQYQKHQTLLQIYSQGAYEKLLGALSIPMKLKYDCPAANKYGEDEDLWITATKCFLQVVRDGLRFLEENSGTVESSAFDGICRQLSQAFRDALLADSTAALTMQLAVQEEHEMLALTILSLFNDNVIPFLRKDTVGDAILQGFAEVIEKGSRIYTYQATTTTVGNSEASDVVPAPSVTFERVDQEGESGDGNTAWINVVVFENLSFACLDALFWMCSSTADGNPSASVRIASEAVKPMLARCKTALETYTADIQLQGRMPFPRLRQQELTTILSKLLELKLVGGCLQTKSEGEKGRLQTICLSGPKAHLFYLYPQLCKSIPILSRQIPAIQDDDKDAEAIPELIQKCLESIGAELGLN